MLIVSQNKDKTTESLEFIIEERKTCKSIFIDKDTYQKFKKVTQKTDDRYLNEKELKGLGELIGKDMTKPIYSIIEIKTNSIFGIYSSKQKAERILGKLIQSYKNKDKVYEIPSDENEGLILF